MADTALFDGLSIAVIIPCYNEAATIGGVVRGFREALPQAGSTSTTTTPATCRR